MNARLNSRGHLLVERNGVFVRQWCAFRKAVECNQECPLLVRGIEWFEFSRVAGLPTVSLCCGGTKVTYRLTEDPLEKAKNGVTTPQFDEADHANPERED